MTSDTSGGIPGAALSGQTAVYLATSAVVGPFELQIVARYTGGDPTKASWLLTGAAVADPTGIRVSRLLEDLAEKLGIVKSFPPGILPELEVTALGVSYDTASRTTGVVLDAAVQCSDLRGGPGSPEAADPDLQLIYQHVATEADGLVPSTEKPWEPQGEPSSSKVSVVGARYTAPIELPAVSGILKGLFDQLTITDLLGAYASGEAKDLTIPGITATDPLTGKTTSVSKDLKLSVEKGFSFLATLNAPGSTEPLALHLGSSSTAPVPVGGAPLAPEAGQPVSKWFKVHKKFGPLAIQRLGVEWNQGVVSLLLDASIEIAVLTVGLDGLAIGFTLEKLLNKDFTPKIALSGLSVTYSAGAVTISGAFLEGTSDGHTVYSGQALIQVETFSIAALGSYEQLDGHPSLFVFVMLDATLGGPSFFFVTGLAGGFGYNRSLQLPDQDDIATYPLVEAAIDPQKEPDEIINNLNQYIRPDLGESWLAAGVRFTSYEMLQSFALLTVAFGNDLEIGLLGVTTLAVPQGVEDPVAVAQLQLEVKLIPASGILSVAGGLTPQSYILSHACRLTGGFAFDAWFGDNPHAGDFVVTFGGYHPDYDKPARYPDEPRIGFRWIDGPVTISGGCYFALTPHAVMAGGGLKVVYQDGDLRAWLTVYADFLIEWKPFHYDIQAGLTLGVSYLLHIGLIHKLLTVELGVTLSLTGPPLSGTAHVSWFVISFTVHFGAKSGPEPPPLKWDQFQTSFLPQRADGAAGSEADAPGADKPRTEAVKLRFAQGVVREVRKKNSNTVEYRTVNAHELELITESVIPCTEITVNGDKVPLPAKAKTELSVRPARDPGLLLKTEHRITARAKTGKGKIEFHKDSGVVVLGNVPSALWGIPESTSIQPPLNPSEPLLADVPRGTVLTLVPPSPPKGAVGPFPIRRLAWDAPGYRSMVWGKFRSAPAKGYDQSKATEEIERTVMSSEIETIRQGILHKLAAKGLPVETKVDLEDFAREAEAIFFEPPILSRLGDLPPKRKTGDAPTSAPRNPEPV